MANPKILFFLAGAVATQAEIDAANLIGPGVQLRNAALIDPTAPLEEADGVAGAPPPPYDTMPGPGADAERRRAIRMGEVPPEELTDEEKARAADPMVTRGAQPPDVNARLAEFRPLPDAPKPDEGWGTGTPPAEAPADPNAPPTTPPPAA